MDNTNPSLSISNPHPEHTDWMQKSGLVLVLSGLSVLFLAFIGIAKQAPLILFVLSFGMLLSGSVIYTIRTYLTVHEGVKNNHNFSRSLTSRGVLAWMLGILITLFYIIIYWYPQLLQNVISIMNPFSNLLRGRPADRWFLYGSLYTTAVLAMGFKALLKYRYSNYQRIRTSSVIFFQLAFSFLIPGLLQLFNQPEFYFSYFWPLKYDYLFPSTVHSLINHPGGMGVFMVFWGAAITFIATPILTYFFGKRWYCSWVCGCGGLANTAGDPFRQLSDKSIKAWKIERWSVYSVLVFIIITTILLWINSITNGSIFGELSQNFAKAYGFFIGAIFSGVIGVGFYPIMGTRVWCRFGCPMAAILGIQQKFFSRFRITTNGGQCISCGNCSTYCEMGIDVRSYAQKGQNIVRASCVGCGICATVCPRGVLKLENGSVQNRVSNQPILIGNNSVRLNEQL
ncbi:MAG: 4Fe-4S binding protein [Bacteroidia bacterium]|nr:4Fe-4S binding protein [Bacteroidia bacterium]